MGVSGRAMLEAFIRGDPHVLAEMAKRKLRNKIPELTEALTGRFRAHHAFLTRLHLDHYDQLTTMIDQLTGRIEEAMAPFGGALDLLNTIPGINQPTAEVITAETGGDMTRFASAKHLASWAGICPGHHESAGRTKNTKVCPGNPYFKGALGLAAFGAVRTKDLPRRPLQAADRTPRPAQGTGRRRALDHHRDLAHAERSRRLPGTRRLLLHPTGS